MHRLMGVGYNYDSASDYDHFWVQNFGWALKADGSEFLPFLIIDRDKASTTSTNVAIYIYGCGCDPSTADWQQMRLRNDGGAWGDWQPFQNNISSWKLNNTPGLRTVEAELKRDAETVILSDSINYTGASTLKIHLPLVVR